VIIKCPYCQRMHVRDDLQMRPVQGEAEQATLFRQQRTPIHGPVTTKPIKAATQRWMKAHPNWNGDLARLLEQYAMRGQVHVNSSELRQRLRAQFGWRFDDGDFAELKAVYINRAWPFWYLLGTGRRKVDKDAAGAQPVQEQLV